MAGYKYSLSTVSVIITSGNKQYRFGGQGSMIGTVSMARKNDRFSAEGDATGGYVINESLDATGTCTISIKQFAPLVDTLTNLFNSYASSGENVYGEATNSAPLTGDGAVSIQLFYNGTSVGKAEGCYLNMPELSFEEDNGTRDFTFECGKVTFEMLSNRNALGAGMPEGTIVSI